MDIAPIIAQIAATLGYDKTHITRAVVYQAVDRFLDTLDCSHLDALEISAGWKWRERNWGSYSEMNWPEYDICADVLDRQFDVVIADNVWEHLAYPYRAARNVHTMLRPDGHFINITPFLIRYHPVPIDCSRWTALGMMHFLEEAGFDAERIHTGSWGNRSAVCRNLRRWMRVGWRRHFPNDPAYPVTVWAIARK
jgi:SAM-dependent methyltransferase